MLASAISVFAGDNHWTGSANNGLWSDSLNWSLGHTPDSSEDVYIDGSSEATVTLNIDAQVGLLQLGGGLGNQTLLVTNSTLYISRGIIATNAVLNLSEAHCSIFGFLSSTNYGKILSSKGATNSFSVYSGEFRNSGVFQAETNADLFLYVYNGSFNDGTRFDGSGTIKLLHDSNVGCHGNMFVNGRFSFDGIISGTNTWHGPGIFDWTEGKFSYGGMTLASNLQVNAVGPLLQLGDQAYLTNDSVFHWLGGVFSSFYSVINIFENRGVMVLDKEASLFWTVFRNTGTILSPPGGTNYFSVYNGDFKNSGTFQADTTAIF
ncbi:MAG: hypothetical protein JWM68_4718, partial [Verrucomicrobiales bacterium]|nr:hypothetical protein [Verrucomicrobiales bacterium]